MNAHPGVPTARLPGVRNWLRGLAEDLRAGRSCVCLLPRVYASGQECFAEELLMELLPQLDDYILLPSGRKVEASERPASEPPPALTAHWSGLPPLLDYDDGLSGFGLTPSLAPTPTPNAGRLPSPAEALKELSNRLAGELGEPSSTIEHRWRAEGVAPSGCTDEVLARLVGRTDGRIEWRPIVIRVWREEAASASTGFLRRLVATAKEAGLAPTHRPCVLLVAAADDLPTDLPDQLSREDVAVHWWWGAIGRLDTATVVTTSRPPSGGLSGRAQLHEAVAQATIVELCGPFLETAAALAEKWDGSLETLFDALRQCIAEAVDDNLVLPGQPGYSRGAGHRPGHTMLTTWNAGLIDKWDGHLRHHPAGDIAQRHTLITRVWLAQHHALLPRLDDAREDFARKVIPGQARIPLPRLADQYGPPSLHVLADNVEDMGADPALTAMELGAMWGALKNRDIILDRAQRRRLRILWNSRNLLAHRTPLDEAGLRDLIGELCD